jgi:hypothetical protein
MWYPHLTFDRACIHMNISYINMCIPVIKLSVKNAWKRKQHWINPTPYAGIVGRLLHMNTNF